MHRDKERHTGEILLDVSVSVWVVGSLYGCVLMFSIYLSVVNAVAMATMTHPSPPTLVILSLKSTELWLGGFHFRMSSHLPGLYFYRDAKNTETNHFMTKQTMQEKNNTPILAIKKLMLHIINSNASPICRAPWKQWDPKEWLHASAFILYLGEIVSIPKPTKMPMYCLNPINLLDHP